MKLESLINSYKNGNVNVDIYSNGTRIRKYEGIPEYDFPCNIDVKITNWCNLDKICTYCHEMSNKNGKHSDIDKLLQVLDPLPAGIELAIGGGDTLSHPEINKLLDKAYDKGWICNVTVNQLHMLKYEDMLSEYLGCDKIKGVGISLRDLGKMIYKSGYRMPVDNLVIHLIAGINNVDDIEELYLMGYDKFLILGYKHDTGNGISYMANNQVDINSNLKQWYMRLPSYFYNDVTISFDNLAIEQLNVRRWFSDREWSSFYQGDDFTSSMYIDAVEQKYSTTSRGVERVSFDDMDLFTYFKNRF